MENKQKINMIQFKKTVYPFCPLGKDHYKGEIHVSIEPAERLFDFCKVDQWIEELGKESLIIEDLVNSVYQIMMQFQPKYLEVTVYGESNKHFPVTVIKEMK